MLKTIRIAAIAVAVLLVLGALSMPAGMTSNLMAGATILRSGRMFPSDQSPTYKETSTRPLAIHVFRRSETAAPGAAVMLIHGGGFHSGWPDEYFPLARRLTNAGHTVFVPEYRLQRRDGSNYAEALEDCRDAVAWVQREAERYGADAAKLVIGGSSAGAHFAAALVTLPRSDGSPLPGAIGLVLSAPFVDSGDASERFEERPAPGPIARALMGEPRDVFEGRSREFSPREHLHAAMPPAVILVGEEDRLWPPGREFCDAMRALGADCAAKTYANVGHAFALYGYEHHEAFVSDVLAAIDRWLERPARPGA